MWSRAAIKEKAKERFKGNYWMLVLAGLIMGIVSGGGTPLLTFVGNFSGSGASSYGYGYSMEPYSDMALVMTMASLLAGVIVIASVIGALVQIFLLNPLSVGGYRYFYKNINGNPSIGEFGFAFPSNYMNVVKIMFLKNLFTGLWSLLLIVPGIVKAYEYRMIPYLLAENPNLTTKEAFATSKRMMDGNKWATFVFDLSFIGWALLSAVTCGLVGLFWMNPYYNQASAMLYDAIKYDTFGPADAQSQQTEGDSFAQQTENDSFAQQNENDPFAGM